MLKIAIAKGNTHSPPFIFTQLLYHFTTAPITLQRVFQSIFERQLSKDLQIFLYIFNGV